MISYVDSIAIVRRLIAEGPPLDSWGTWDAAVTSQVGRIEVHRTLARLRHEGRLTLRTAATAISDFEEMESGILWLPLTDRVAAIAAGPFPSVLKALDAIHMASAIFVREINGSELVFVTHDRQLANAAVAMGFLVEGT